MEYVCVCARVYVWMKDSSRRFQYKNETPLADWDQLPFSEQVRSLYSVKCLSIYVYGYVYSASTLVCTKMHVFCCNVFLIIIIISIVIVIILICSLLLLLFLLLCYCCCCNCSKIDYYHYQVVQVVPYVQCCALLLTKSSLWKIDTVSGNVGSLTLFLLSCLIACLLIACVTSWLALFFSVQRATCACVNLLFAPLILTRT